MLDDGVEVFAVALPLLEAFLGVRLELFVLVLEVGFGFLGLLELLADLGLAFALLLLHLALEVDLVLSKQLFSELLVLFLHRLDI